MLSSLESRDSDVVSTSVDTGVLSSIATTGDALASILSTSENSTLNTETPASTSLIDSEGLVVSELSSVAVTSSVIETAAPRGLKGEPGAAAGMLMEYPVAYPVSGHRMVVLNVAEQVIYADCTVITHANKVLGMTTQAAVVGDVAVQRGGVLIEPTWSWILDTPIWLSTNGLMSQVPPVSGFSLIIGFPLDATSMFIDIREPIFLL